MRPDNLREQDRRSCNSGGPVDIQPSSGPMTRAGAVTVGVVRIASSMAHDPGEIVPLVLPERTVAPLLQIGGSAMSDVPRTAISSR